VNVLTFAKAHAYGNDFLYIERAHVEGADLSALAQTMCDRHTGVGADGLIVFVRTPEGATMRLFNADGSRSEVSGNGIRGLAALLLERDPRTNAAVSIETEAGPKRLPLVAAGIPLEAVVLRFGNPQCVVLGELPDERRFATLGAALERHEYFPDRTNVEFARVEPDGAVRILIWERGVGPTQSSGTGSCASLVAAASFGGANRSSDVVAPGGTQRVEWLDDSVYLTGWAEIVCRGEWLRQIPRPA
jgi:diaminopimelate epimerase